MRRAAFTFDTAYPGQSLPVIRAEFRQSSGIAGVVFDRVIPGREATRLPALDRLSSVESGPFAGRSRFHGRSRWWFCHDRCFHGMGLLGRKRI